MNNNRLKTAKLNIQKIYRKYSFDDICNSLFVLSHWLPNISSVIKPIFLYVCLLEIYDYDWDSNNKIKNYEDFKDFYNKIRIYIPEFHVLEDYIPEQDWGDVYYYINGRCYKYLYGGELENTYDHLKFFELYHCSLKEELETITEQNPLENFECILKLQEHVINNIPNQKNTDKIKLGYFKLPDETFWNKCNTFLFSLNLLDIFKSKTLDWYSQKNAILKNISSKDNFAKAFFEGKILNKLFIKKNNNYYILPLRRCAAVLLDIWNKIISENIDRIPQLEYCTNKSLFDYVENKLYPPYTYYREVSIIDGETEFLKTDAFIAADNKLLFLILGDCQNCQNEQNFYKYLENINLKIKDIKNFIVKNKYITLSKSNYNIKISTEDFPNQKFEIKFIIIRPSLSTAANIIPFNYKPEFILFPYVDFLQLVDTSTGIEDLFKKFNFLEKISHYGCSSISDWLAFYSENEGEILSGYREFTDIILDPFISSNTRYKKLRKFWEKSPKETIYGIPPYNWEIERIGDSNSIEMFSPHYQIMAICSHIAQTDIFINSLPNIDADLIKAIHFFAQIIDDIFNIHKLSLQQHIFFKTHKKLQIEIISYEMITKNDIKPLKDKTKNNNIWNIDTINFENKFILRIIFNGNKLYEQLKNVTDRELVNDLLIDIIKEINRYFHDDETYKNIIKQAHKDKKNPTRFMVNTKTKETCFPEYHSVVYPEKKDFIRVQNLIAKILHTNNIKSGEYYGNDYKRIIEILKQELIMNLNNEIKNYAFINAIPFLIENNDANTNSYEMEHMKIKLSLKHSVDYSRENHLKKAHEKYLREAKNYRYLIEKFVQLSPSGHKIIDKDALSYLLALVDWILVMYQHSDIIYYNLLETGLIIKEDKTIETVFLDKTAEQEDMYSEIEVKEELYPSPNDIKFTSIMDDYDKFNDIFKKDFGFKFQNMINLLSVLSKWGNEDFCYIIATTSEIIDKMNLFIKDLTNEEELEIPTILDFLTLKREEVTTILNKNDSSKIYHCKDIPVDEFNLRYSRYTIKPLIKYQNSYIWGPYSALNTGKTFCKHIMNTRLPYKPQKENTLNYLNNIKKYTKKNL